jgi:hypothetical protein
MVVNIFYHAMWSLYGSLFRGGYTVRSPTPHITGSKKQSEERAVLFAVRVHVIVMQLFESY